MHQEVLDFLSDTLTTASQKVAKSHLRMKAAYEEQQEALVLQEADLALALHALRQTGSELCRRQLEIAETRARTDEAGRTLDSLQPVAHLVESVKALLEKGPEDSAADGTMRMLQQALRNLGENSLADVAPKVLSMEPHLRDGFAKTVEHHLVQEITKLEETVAQILKLKLMSLSAIDEIFIHYLSFRPTEGKISLHGGIADISARTGGLCRGHPCRQLRRGRGVALHAALCFEGFCVGPAESASRA